MKYYLRVSGLFAFLIVLGVIFFTVPEDFECVVSEQCSVSDSICLPVCNPLYHRCEEQCPDTEAHPLLERI